MRKRMAAFVLTIVALTFLVGAPASAAENSRPPRSCAAAEYSVLFGEGITVRCFPPYPGFTYRAVAHCASGNAFWTTVGYWVPFGSSSAECVGGLLSPASVIGYDVDVL
ncbi:hypothetical protein [Amycolatopsis samaneae]|uniref:Uncharacterized protein n=1 Tax=Amycolatopsis samaneae TaxID=664691 RepID=A0ABW5GPH2_9PSEU